jgi:hypothetical protein
VDKKDSVALKKRRDLKIGHNLILFIFTDSMLENIQTLLCDNGTLRK